jgi:hypothetical protein
VLLFFGAHMRRTQVYPLNPSVIGGKSQALSINRGQVNHVEADAEPEEPENQEEVPREAEEASEEGNEQQD